MGPQPRAVQAAAGHARRPGARQGEPHTLCVCAALRVRPLASSAREVGSRSREHGPCCTSGAALPPLASSVESMPRWGGACRAWGWRWRAVTKTCVAARPCVCWRAQNLYFAYLFVLRAVSKAAPLLSRLRYDTGMPEEDERTTRMVQSVVSGRGLLTSCFGGATWTVPACGSRDARSEGTRLHRCACSVTCGPRAAVPVGAPGVVLRAL